MGVRSTIAGLSCDHSNTDHFAFLFLRRETAKSGNRNTKRSEFPGRFGLGLVVTHYVFRATSPRFPKASSRGARPAS